MHFDLVASAVASEYRRTAARTEMAVAEFVRFPLDRHRVRREYGRREEQGAVMLAAVEAMAKPNALRPAGRRDPHFAAQATAPDLVHREAPKV